MVGWFCFVSFLVVFAVFFFFNDTATTEIYTLSLHDALPTSPTPSSPSVASSAGRGSPTAGKPDPRDDDDQHINPRDLLGGHFPALASSCGHPLDQGVKTESEQNSEPGWCNEGKRCDRDRKHGRGGGPPSRPSVRLGDRGPSHAGPHQPSLD